MDLRTLVVTGKGAAKHEDADDDQVKFVISLSSPWEIIPCYGWAIDR